MKKTFFSVVVLRILGVSLSFLISLFIARCMHIRNAGVFFNQFSFLMLWGLISTIGSCDTILKYWPKLSVTISKKCADGVAIHLFILVVFFSSIIAIISYVLSLYGYNKNISSLIYLLIPMFSINQYLGYYFQSRGYASLAIFVINIIYQVVFLIISYLWYVFCGIIEISEVIKILFLALLTTMIFSVIIFFIFTYNHNKYADRKVGLSKCYEFKNIYYPLFLFWIILVSNSIIQWLTPAISYLLVSYQDVAKISICVRIGLIISFFLVSMNIIFAPLFSKEFSCGNDEGLKRIVIKSSRYIFILSCPIAICLFFFPRLFLSFFGKEYISAYNILRIICIGQFVNIITGSVSYLLTMTGYQRIFKNILVSSAILLIFNLFILGHFWGVNGIAIAVAISMSFQNILSAIYVKRKLGINIFGYLYKL